MVRERKKEWRERERKRANWGRGREGTGETVSRRDDSFPLFSWLARRARLSSFVRYRTLVSAVDISLSLCLCQSRHNDGGDAAVILLHATCCPLAARSVTLIRSRAEQRRAGGRPNLAPDLGNAPAHRRSELTAVWTGKPTFSEFLANQSSRSEMEKTRRERDE